MKPEDLKKLISPHDGGVYLQCWIQPKASANAIKGIHGDALKISLSAPPVDGKANAALCAFISEKLSIPKSAVKINSGFSSRKKKLFISNIPAERLLKVLCD